MPATQDIFAFMKDLVLNITDTEEEQIQPSTRVEHLGLESMDLVELQITVRKKFGVEVAARAFADGQLTTLGDVVDYIGNQMTLKMAG
jgi:acyl carrier protein